MELRENEKAAIFAATPFGGTASKKMKPLLNKLRNRGLIEITTMNPDRTRYDYVLTRAGNELLNANKSEFEMCYQNQKTC